MFHRLAPLRHVIRGALLCFFLLFLGADGMAQGGYSKQDFPRFGLKGLPVPKRWVPVPIPPTEEHVVLGWAEKVPGEKDRQERRSLRPTLEVVLVNIDPDAVDESSTAGKVGRGRAINSVETYLGSVSSRGGWESVRGTEALDPVEGRQRYIREYIYDSGQRTNSRSITRAGWVFEWRSETQVLFFFGQCAEEDSEEMIKIWRHMATKLKLVEPKEPDLSKWVRYYEKHPRLRGAEFRLAVRARMSGLKGWKIEDTENYMLLYSTKDQALIRLLKRELEAIRRAYEGLFPTPEPLDVVSVLRVCKDRDEYTAYGGPPRSGGYWSPGAEELVFFDYEDVDREAGSGKANSRVVLYHEAFHQYVHYAAGDIAPHSWFNEGTGDYFSGVRFDGTGAVSAIAANPWRLETSIDIVKRKRAMELDDLFTASQRKYYTNGGPNYAQGWSLVYFLLTSGVVAKRPEWAKIHPLYYSTLQAEWGVQRAELEAEDLLDDREAYLGAQEGARDAALEAALEGVDVNELQKAWKAFVLDLED
ncbi:MAG: hypothetical protein ACI9K5_001675 [Gammaproteobacteria bacterium]|jgi:hypothetical protein